MHGIPNDEHECQIHCDPDEQQPGSECAEQRNGEIRSDQQSIQRDRLECGHSANSNHHGASWRDNANILHNAFACIRRGGSDRDCFVGIVWKCCGGHQGNAVRNADIFGDGGGYDFFHLGSRLAVWSDWNHAPSDIESWTNIYSDFDIQSSAESWI